MFKKDFDAISDEEKSFWLGESGYIVGMKKRFDETTMPMVNEIMRISGLLAEYAAKLQAARDLEHIWHTTGNDDLEYDVYEAKRNAMEVLERLQNTVDSLQKNGEYLKDWCISPIQHDKLYKESATFNDGELKAMESHIFSDAC